MNGLLQALMGMLGGGGAGAGMGGGPPVSEPQGVPPIASSTGFGMPAGGGEGGGGGLGGLGNPDTMRRLMQSLGGGLAKVNPTHGAGAFAAGMGGALSGGAAADDTIYKRGKDDREQSMKELNADDMFDHRNNALDQSDRHHKDNVALRGRALSQSDEQFNTRMEQGNRRLDQRDLTIDDNYDHREGSLEERRVNNAGRRDLGERRLEERRENNAGRLDVQQRAIDERGGNNAARRTIEEQRLEERRLNNEGRLDVSRDNAATNRTRAERPPSWNKPPEQLVLDAEREIRARTKDVTTKYGVNAPGLSPDERSKRRAAADMEIGTYSKELYNRLGIQPAGISPPAAPAAAVPAPQSSANQPAEIKGQGTQAAPFSPMSKADYDNMPSGTYYIHPSDGKLKLKK